MCSAPVILLVQTSIEEQVMTPEQDVPVNTWPSSFPIDRIVGQLRSEQSVCSPAPNHEKHSGLPTAEPLVR